MLTIIEKRDEYLQIIEQIKIDTANSIKEYQCKLEQDFKQFKTQSFADAEKRIASLDAKIQVLNEILAEDDDVIDNCEAETCQADEAFGAGFGEIKSNEDEDTHVKLTGQARPGMPDIVLPRR